MGTVRIEQAARGEPCGRGWGGSFLEVDDANLLESVRLVRASLWHPAPRAYRTHAGVAEHDLATAVVVMRMVNATRAGVVFTANPAGEPNRDAHRGCRRAG